jgi:hypothetical protein
VISVGWYVLYNKKTGRPIGAFETPSHEIAEATGIPLEQLIWVDETVRLEGRLS